MINRVRFIGEGNFECLEVNICGWSSPDGKPVSLILYPKRYYDVEGNPVSIEFTLEEIDRFCETLKACKDNFEGKEE
jgi:hypothetical protein